MYAYVIKDIIGQSFFPKNPVMKVNGEMENLITLAPENDESSPPIRIESNLVITASTKKELLISKIKYYDSKKEIESLPEIEFMKSVFIKYYGKNRIINFCFFARMVRK